MSPQLIKSLNKKQIVVALILVAVGAWLISVVGVSAAGGDVDPTFNSGGSGADGQVRVMAVQPDGKILIGGIFFHYNAVDVPERIIRLNANGTYDSTFNSGGSGADNSVDSIALQPDGKILIGGTFTQYNGVNVPRALIRLNDDGTPDSTFNPGGSGVGGGLTPVREIAVQPDGKILVGGSFTQYNGDAAAPDHIIRLNSDGTRDTTFNSGGSGLNAGAFVEAIALQPDGKILIGGNFFDYNGDVAPPNFIMRLNSDGTWDATFNSGGSGATSTVIAIALRSDGKILIGGGFTQYNGADVPDRIIRLNSDGTPDSTFNSGGSGANGPVNNTVKALALQPDGKILVVGNFTQYNGVDVPDCIIRLNSNGTRDTTFNSSGSGANSTVFTIALQPDGKILIGGDFTQYNGADVPDDIIRLLPASGTVAFSSANYSVAETAGNASITVKRTGGTDNQVVAKVTLADVTTSPADYRFTPGAYDTAFNSGGSGACCPSVNAVEVQLDGKILIGGSFLSYNGAVSDFITRLNSDGTRDTTFNSGGSGANSTVHSIAVQPDGKILIGGSFTQYNGADVPDRIMRLNSDGTPDSTFNSGGSGSDATVTAIALQPDGRVLIGGSFTQYNGADVPDRIMRLNSNGTWDNTFNSGGSGSDATVTAIALQPDGRVLIVGEFTTYNGVDVPDDIMRLNSNGTWDNTFNSGGSGASGATITIVEAIALQPDGKILIGGLNFFTYNGDAAAPDGIMRLNSDGTWDTTFNSGGSGADFTPQAIEMQPDGKILVGGSSTLYNGVDVPDHIMRLNTDGTPDSTFNSSGSGASGSVQAIALRPDGKILIGGGFTSYNGVDVPDRIIRLDGDLFVTWNAGDSADKIIQLPIINDAINEADETLNLTLSLMSGGATLGSPSSATLTIQDAPTITAASGLSRPQGSAANSQIATVTDGGGNGSVIVTVTSANPSNGVTISNIQNTGGNITADIAADCAATNASFTLQASDGSLTATATLNVTVTANTAPVLTYANPSPITLNGSTTVNPATGPTDNVSVSSIVVQSVGAYTGNISVNNSTGVVSISNAAPPGQHTITIRATDNCGLITDASFTLDVNKGNQAITVNQHAPANATFNSQFTVAATSDSGLPVTYGSAGACSNSGATFTMTSGTGTCTVKYDQVGDNNYNAASQVIESVTAQKANQTIIANPHAPASATYNASFTVGATSDSGLPLTFSSAGVCSNASATFTMTSGTGTCTVKYDQVGDGNYNAASQVTEAVAAQKANQTITVNPHAPANATFNSQFTVAATSDSGLPVTYGSAGACSNSGATFTMTSGTGTCTVKYDQLGDGNYNAASQVTESVTAQKANQTITANPHAPSNATFNTSFTVGATSDSGLPVTFSSAGVCTNASATFTMTSGTGTCTVKYDRAGDGNYNAASQATESVAAQKANQTITANPHAPANATYNTSFTVGATSHSGLAIAFSSAGVCSNTGGTFTMTSGTGTCTVKYDQTGDGNYNTASQVTESVTAQKANQTITFGALPDKTFGDPDFNVSPAATSGLAVTLAASLNCTVTTPAPGTVHLTVAGGCTITASQGGNDNYNAAPNQVRSFTTLRAATNTALTSSVNPSEPGQSVTFSATVSSGAGTPTGNVQFKDGGANLGSPVALDASAAARFTTSSLTAGTHTITAEYGITDNFLASTGTLSGGQIVKAQPTLSINDVSIAEGDSGTTALNFTVTLSSASSLTVKVDFATANGTAITPEYLAANGTLTFNPGDLTKTISVTINGDINFEPNETFTVNLTNPVNAGISKSTGTGTIQNDDPAGGVIALSKTDDTVSEATGFITVTVVRSKDVSQAVNVDYATDDTGASPNCATLNSGLASSRCDFTLMLGTLKFAANETQKTLDIPINRDGYQEGPETFKFVLSNPTGGAILGLTSSQNITITDSVVPSANAIDDTSLFVRQQYHDFLNREPDTEGLAFWKDNIDKCMNPTRIPPGQLVAQCLETQRIITSAAFLLSIEFRQTGGLVRDFYVAALDRPATNNMPNLIEFTRATQAIQRGLVVGQDNWQALLAANQSAFMNDFVTQAEFVGLYPTSDTPAQYVDKLYLHANVTPGSAQERDNAIAEFGGAATAANAGARGRALFRITQNAAFQARELNRAFVHMEYFGYLRRNPNNPPDSNFNGYDFWVNKLNQFNGDFLQAEMVKAFLNSGEYRGRFGP